MTRAAVGWVWPEDFQIAASDRGLAYADGLFETLRIAETRPVLLDAHLNRLRAGAKHLGLPIDDDLLHRWWSEAWERSRGQDKVGEGVIKLVVTRGSGGRGYRPPDRIALTWITSFHAAPPPAPEQGVDTTLCRTRVRAGTGGFKTLERLDQVQASAELAPTVYEGLMLDHAGRLTEGTRTNLFLLDERGAITPPAGSLAVNGVMRRALLALLPEQGIPVREGFLQWEQVRRAGGLILVNSVSGVVPVRRIGCMELPTDPRVATIRRFSKQAFGL